MAEVAHAGQGNLDKAIEDYTDAIRLDPHFAKAYCNREIAYCNLNRGLAYYNLGNLDKAVSDYTEAIRLKYANLNRS